MVGWTLVVGFLVLEPTLHMISLFSNDLAHGLTISAVS